MSGLGQGQGWVQVVQVVFKVRIGFQVMHAGLCKFSKSDIN